MKQYLMTILMISLYACSNAPEEQQKEVAVSEVEEVVESATALEFGGMSGQVVLIGKKITLLDKKLQPIGDISNLNGKVVDLMAVSDSLLQPTQDLCAAFWYVEINTGDQKGIVDGRQAYQLLESKKAASFGTANDEVAFLRTESFGMGQFYAGDVTDCSVSQPIVLKTKDYYGLVELVPNEYSKKASWGTDYAYWELKNDAGGYDEITNLKRDGDLIKLTIQRGFQEGKNSSEVVLKWADNKYTATYLTFGAVK